MSYYILFYLPCFSNTYLWFSSYIGITCCPATVTIVWPCFPPFVLNRLSSDVKRRLYFLSYVNNSLYFLLSLGEDRWLCTLLLQQGYRVEYSAASDAYTHCPEGFNEFYNQRRRWVPSTMANILDLLNDFNHITKVNDNISMLYIGYQVSCKQNQNFIWLL